MACALQSLINRPQSTSPLVMEGTRKDWLPSKTLLHFQILSFAKITCSYFPHVLTKQCVGSARKKKITACRSRSRATRPSGRRASGTPSWTSRTGRTRTTRGTATRTGARWPPTPCGSPTGTGSRRTIRPTISSEDESCSWLFVAVPHDQ